MGNAFRNLDFSIITTAVFSVIPALICITFHELSHGFVAYKLGDRTAKDMGRLTFNPIKHIDVFGLLMMLVFGFGWAKPVPVNMLNFKNPKRGMAITALAGPVSNLLLAAVVMVIYGIALVPLAGSAKGSAGAAVLTMIDRTATLSIALAVFNMIPIPPLDGSKVLFSLMPDRAYIRLMQYERFGFIILIVLMYTKVFDSTIVRLTQSIGQYMLEITIAVYRLLT